MGELNTTNVANLYNTRYPEGIETLIMPVSPTVGLIGKDIKVWDGLGGNGKQLEWETGMGTGASGSYSEAIAQYGHETFYKPTITRGRLFATRRIDIESWRASKGNGNAAIDLMEQAVKGATRELKQRVGTLLNGGPKGTIGKISAASDVGTATITLSNVSQAKNFKPGQRLNLLNPSTLAIRNTAASVITIAAGGIDREAGTLTFTGNVTAGIAAAVAGDLLIPVGDLNQVPKTMDEWNPLTLIAAGASDNFFGVDRGGSVEMQGLRYAATSGSFDDILIQAEAYASDMGGEFNICFANPRDIATLKQDLPKVQRRALDSMGKEMATVSYDGVVLKTGHGDVEIFSDPFRPRGFPRLTNRDAWKIWSLGKMFDRINEGMGADGTQRVSDAAAVMLVFGGFWQLVCTRPIDSCLISLPGASVIL